ncbi:hypothetical protein CK203_023625 [Vitis vinifera]|uniref:Uncharacterized protein n=1 Tax=Vitis vinifera TaxID=29760 RepID=A0A438EAN1_VITVI|nr:hypothetical protein CK203_081798 [Vitis vinifera]RVX06399.1 hypothetical protein CK203_023625 [Vitis vinifera]
MEKLKPCESILMFIKEDVVDSQSRIVLKSLIGNYVFNKSLSTKFAVYLTFIDVF